MLRKYILIVLLFVIYASKGQDGGFTGMGNSSVMLYDFWAIQNNQAGLANIDTLEIGVSYNHNYQLWQTGVQAAGIVMPTRSGNFALSGYRYGYANYAEHNFSLSYARHLGSMFSASLSFNYLYYSQSQNLGYKGAVLFQVGLISKPVENLQIGLHLYNPGRVRLEDYDNKRVPTVIRFGLGYFFSEQILFSVETEKDIDEQNRFKSGLQYEPIDNFFIRTGFQSNPNQFSVGIGYIINSLAVDMAAITHEILPISGQISFKYKF